MGTGEACCDHPGEEDWLDISSQRVDAQIASLLETRIPFLIFFKAYAYLPLNEGSSAFPTAGSVIGGFFFFSQTHLGLLVNGLSN